MELWSRRKFFLTSLIGSAVAGAGKLFGRTCSPPNGAAATALAFPGSQASADFQGSRFSIDGRDTRLADGPGTPTGPGPAVYGITVNDTLPALAAEVRGAIASGPQNDVADADQIAEIQPIVGERRDEEDRGKDRDDE